MLYMRRLIFVAMGMLGVASTFAQPRKITIQDLTSEQAPAGAVWLDAQDLSPVFQDRGRARACKSFDNHTITLNKVEFKHGIGTHANSVFGVDLHKTASRFVAVVGVDDEVGQNGHVSFEVWVDKVKKAQTEAMKGKQEPQLISVDLTGAEKMVLLAVTDDKDGPDKNDHAVWAGAAVFTTSNSIKVVPGEAFPNIMPKIASCDVSKTSINGPRVLGTTPGKPFLFMVPATGESLSNYSATGLPAGLKIDSKSGIITGSVMKVGRYEVMLSVKGKSGSVAKKLVIDAGVKKLALTPPMGWNSWNCWGEHVSEEKIRAAVDAMVSSGLAAHGFQYINIDDSWMRNEGVKRLENGEINPRDSFPNMKALADYIHGKGLKLGIYSSPGKRTCAGCAGSFGHEDQDAKTYAKWGVDYLKYDWCSYGDETGGNPDRDASERPYMLMSASLNSSSRDIVLSICQYGRSNVWEWGAEVGGQLWRTTEDIQDTWGSMAAIGFTQSDHAKYAGPGHWNDPDMLVVGKVGWGPTLHPTRLKYSEQVTHISLWSLLAAPLLIGCDMTDMDPFTINLLTNDEVLGVDQDSLGKEAVRVAADKGTQVWSRPLQDGTVAVGLFNTGVSEVNVTALWEKIGVQGKQPVRDLWLKKDLGSFEGQFTAKILPHGAMMLKIGKPRQN
jgi:alpha-galactosidase